MRDEVGNVRVAAAASLAGTGALMAAGAVEAESPWAPFNTMAAALLGEQAAQDPGFQPRATPVGLAIILGGLAGYGFVYHRLFGKVRFPQSLLTGALAGAALYGFDYYLLPKPLRPGFERYLSWTSISLKYAAVALALGGVTRNE